MNININLLPWREQKSEQRKKEYIIWISFCAAFCIFILVCIDFYFAYKIENQENINKNLKLKNLKLDNKILSLEALKKEKENMFIRVQTLEQLKKERCNIIQLFNNVTRIVPEGLYLTSLNRTGAQVLIEGKAESNAKISQLMQNIEVSSELTHPVLNLIQVDEAEKNTHEIGFYLQAIQSQNDNLYNNLDNNLNNKLDNKLDSQ